MIDTKALREKVLDLAIRGKLVPQDPNDEPATVLLERIREQKKQMVKEGKLKAKDIKNDTIIFKGDDNLHYEQFSDGTVKCIEDEIPFELPAGWAWTRICNIATVRGGKRVPKGMTFAQEKTSHAYIRVTDMKNHTVNTRDLKYIDEDVFTQIKNYTVAKNDLYITIAGTIGAIGEIPDELDGMNLTENAVKVTSYGVNKSYLCLVLQSELVQKQFSYKTYQVAMPKLGLERILTTLIPVCGSSTQKAICDAITEASRYLEQVNINQADLISLISYLKSKILDLAIQGKLVPQNQDDEPASVLLERIRAEKEELIKAGKIKRDKKESFIFKSDDNSYYEKVGNEVTCIDGEVLFEIPQGWCYTRLSSISEIIMGSSPNGTSINRNGNGMEFHQGKICFTDKIIGHSISFTDKSVKLAKENSLLLCVRAPVGEVNITDRCVCIGRGLSAISPLSKMQTEFLFYWLQSFKKVLLQKATGSTFVAITADTVKNICIPLPPLEEQNRICKAIDKIFVVLDIIEQSLN